MIYRLSFRDLGRTTSGPVVPGQLQRWRDPDFGPPDQATLDTLAQEPKVTFLLHGFNVGRDEGTVALTRFAELLAGVPGGLVATLWPGDSRLGGVTYPFEGSAADDTAQELVTFILERLRPCPPISFASHSLGGRVVLSAMRLLAEAGVSVEQVCLMAPAVDDTVLADPHEFRQATALADRVGVLHSEEDNVLKWIYPVGDWLQAFIFFWREEAGFALGYGGPKPTRDDTLPSNVIDIGVGEHDVDHGHYLPPADPATGVIGRQTSAAHYASELLTEVDHPTYPDP